METTTFNFTKGDTYSRGFTIENLGIPIDKVYFTVKEKSSDKNCVLQKKLNQGIERDSQNPNRYVLTIDADDTNSFKTNYNYLFDIEIITVPIKQKAIKKTIVKGYLKLDDWDITSKANEV